MKLIVTGSAKHGKDTVCTMLCKLGQFSFESSSHFVALKAVAPYLASRGKIYRTFDEMYEDRINHRAEWHNAIWKYNRYDHARLGRELFQKYDIYCGLRRREEMLAMRAEGLFSYLIWVDATKRLPPEPSTSINITQADADFTIDNNGDLADLTREVTNLWEKIK